MRRTLSLLAHPWTWTLVLAALLLAQLNWHILAAKRQTQVLATRAALDSAILHSQLQLASKLQPLAADQALARHLDWQMANSVKGSLTSAISPGLLDRLIVMDSQCRPLQQVGKGPAWPCATLQAGSTQGISAPLVLATSGETGTIRLGLVLPLSAGPQQNNLLVGDLALDDTWLGRHPALASQLQTSGLALTTADTPLGAGEVLWSPASARLPLQLSSRQPLDQWLTQPRPPGSHNLAAQAREPWLWSNLAALALSISCGLILSSKSRFRLRRAIHEHLAEVRAAMPGLPSPAAAAPLANTPAPPLKQLQKARLWLEEMRRQHERELRQLRDENASLSHKLHLREGETSDLRQRLAGQAAFASLAAQVQEATDPFLEKLAELEDQVLCIEASARSDLAKDVEPLAEKAEAWTFGLRERGARKFIRSLAETPCRQEQPDGPSMLEAAIDDFAKIAFTIQDHAIKQQLLAGNAKTLLTELMQLGEHWRSLAAAKDSQVEDINLADALVEAHKLQRLRGLNIPVSPPDAQHCHWPRMPRRTAVAALHHLLSAFAEWRDLGGTQFQITARGRDDERGTMVVFSLGQEAGRQPAILSSTQNRHLETAKALLAPYKVSLRVLPSRTGAYPVVIHWQEHEPLLSPDHRLPAAGPPAI